MINLKFPLIANRKSLGIHLRVEMDTEVLVDRPGSSFTKNFIDALRRYMHRDNFYSERFPTAIPGLPTTVLEALNYEMDPGAAFWQINTSTSSPITGIADNGSGLVRVTCSSNVDVGTGFRGENSNVAYLHGIEDFPQLNGFWEVNVINDQNIFDLVGSTWPGGSFTGAGDPAIKTCSHHSVYSTSDSGYLSAQHGSHSRSDIPQGFIVGAATTPVSITDSFLFDLISYGAGSRQLTYGTVNRTPPSVVGTQTEMSEARQLTNNSGDTISIGEIGLCCTITHNGQPFDDENLLYVISRDLLSVDVPDNSSISITYRLRTETPTTGGFTRQFLELIYRELSGSSREAKDILNVDRSDGESQDQMFLNGIIGESSSTPFSPNLLIGPVVGNGTKDVEPADYKLRDGADNDTIIVHGDGAGELFYNRGCTVGPPRVSGGTCSFLVTRFAENQSGATVTISEAGLYCHNIGSVVPLCIARNLVDPAVEVPDGEVVKIEYEIGANV